MIQEGTDNHDLKVCIAHSRLMEKSGSLLVRDHARLFYKVSVEAFFAIAQQELLPLACERLAEFDRHVSDEDID